MAAGSVHQCLPDWAFGHTLDSLPAVVLLHPTGLPCTAVGHPASTLSVWKVAHVVSVLITHPWKWLWTQREQLWHRRTWLTKWEERMKWTETARGATESVTGQHAPEVRDVWWCNGLAYLPIRKQLKVIRECLDLLAERTDRNKWDLSRNQVTLTGIGCKGAWMVRGKPREVLDQNHRPTDVMCTYSIICVFIESSEPVFVKFGIQIRAVGRSHLAAVVEIWVHFSPSLDQTVLRHGFNTKMPVPGVKGTILQWFFCETFLQRFQKEVVGV